MRKHQVFVFVGDGLGLGEALVGEGAGEADVELGAGVVLAVLGVVFASVGVADFVGEAEGLADGLLLAEATGS